MFQYKLSLIYVTINFLIDFFLWYGTNFFNYSWFFVYYRFDYTRTYWIILQTIRLTTFFRDVGPSFSRLYIIMYSFCR